VALSIGELVAYLKTDDTQLRAGLTRAEGGLRDFGQSAKQGLAVAGAAAGTAIGVGIAQNLDIGAGRAKLAAQLDLSAEDSARIGAVAGKVYANNFGGSLDEVNTAIRAVGDNLGDVTKMSAKDLQQVTQSALALADVFGADVTQSSEAAGKMIKNGLAKNSTEAFDIMTKGFQLGLDKSGDFLDTINEYSPQFAKLGIDGPHALTLLSAGLKAGARDTDTIADAFKEFSLRAIDGSKGTAEGFKAAGLDAKRLAKDIAAGGPAAQAATMTTLQALQQIKDPIAQNAAGVALFGTQWEDTLRGILPAMAGAEEGMQGVEGATQRMADTAGGSGKAKIETMKRAVEQWIQEQTSGESSLGTLTAGVMAFGGPALAMAGTLGQVVVGLAALNIGAMASAVWTGIAAVGTKAWAAAQWILNAAMSANPIGLVVIAIIALVAGLIYAWKHSETFRNVVIGAWNAIKAAGSAVFGWLGGFISGTWDKIKGAASAAWGFITGYIRTQINIVLGVIKGIGKVYNFFKDAFDRASNAISNAVSGMIKFVRGIPGSIKNALGNLGGLLSNAGKQVIQGFLDGIKSMIGSVKNALGGLTGMLPSWKGPAERDRNILVGNGALVMAGFIRGMEGQYGAVRSSLAGLTGDLPGIPAPRSGGIGGIGGAAPGQAAAGRAVTLRFSGDREIGELFKRIVRVEFGGDVLTMGS